MAAPKGHPRYGGRQKGTPNKNTTAVKEMVLAALDKAGGIQYLLAQARDNPTAFLTLVGKVIPLQVAGDQEQPVRVVQEIVLRGVSAQD